MPGSSLVNFILNFLGRLESLEQAGRLLAPSQVFADSEERQHFLSKQATEKQSF